jgi:uncharacterized delta-60 repeat protein
MAAPAHTRAAALFFALAAALLAGLAIDSRAEAASPLDPSFGKRGVTVTHGLLEAGAFALARDDQGRLIAAGTTFFEKPVLARYRANGMSDLSFGDEGIKDSVEGQGASSVLVQPDGKILVGGGERMFALARHRENGDLDPSFGKRGKVITQTGVEGSDALALALQPNGRILAGGYGINLHERWTGLLIAYKPDGAIDRRFARNGMVKFKAPGKRAAEISGVEVLPGGKILLAGDLGGRILVARLLPNGKFDRGFGGGDGRVLLGPSGRCDCAYASALAVAPGGKALVAGYQAGPRSEQALLLRVLPSGRLDPSFGNRGTVRTLRGSRLILNGLTLAHRGRILTTGFFNSSRTGEAQVAVLRYLRNGELDPGFARAGFFSRDFGHESIGYAALTQPDGRVVIAGRANPKPPLSPELGSALDGAKFMLMRFRG